ncbi:Lysophospholipase L1 [Pedococcus dokdonensis]|uniref:Lysophospholipase L1 n=1 Tax=Pedococcus dokdonensis TaxID=443156 RepID=A0A1H0M8R1_9MICO|nr:SGNH/GDSL hydrolase family protein [Pedococcus dokdonensis]SDO76859.1 Lysophospholipase L1 [Pedococcus dokdonensis]
MSVGFDYDNTGARPAGAVMRALSALLPGVGAVREQTEPYAAAWRRSNDKALAADGPLWVAIGDSMTQGIGASAPDRGWVGQLADHLADAGRPHRVVNLSVTGARVQDALDQQLPALRDLVAMGQVPDLVTVVIGSNDVVSPRLRAGLTDRFTQLLDGLPDGAVVANLPNPHREARRVSALLREREREGRLVVADMRAHGPRSWRGKLAADKFHPNDAGYAGMARVFDLALGLEEVR